MILLLRRILGCRVCRIVAGLCVVLTTMAGCATAPPPVPVAPGAPRLDVDHLEERALLLLLADRGTYDPLTIGRALDGPPDLRVQAAFTLARIGEPRVTRVLEGLLGDPAAEVRRAAAFNLGSMAGKVDDSAVRELLAAVGDPDRETGILAIEALARLGVPLEPVIDRLADVPEAEVLPRLLPPLFRFRSPEVVRWAEVGLVLEDPRLHALAAYALAREPQSAGIGLLRELLADPDPWVRGWAARALGNIGQREDLDRLRPLLDDPAPGPIVRALGAARQLISAGKVAAPDAWLPRIVELLADPRPGVRLTAIETSAVWLLDDRLGAALAGFADSSQRRERELALLALAEGGDPRGAALVVRWAGDPDPAIRQRVAEAAALYGAQEVLLRLAEDPVPSVRQAALDVRLAASDEAAASVIARRALGDPDPAVRATALAWAEEHPVIEIEALAAAFAGYRDRLLDARLAAAGAFRARAEAEPLERGALVAALEELARDPEPAIHRAAAEALGALDREPPAPTPGDRRPVSAYRQMVQRTWTPPRFEVETERGSFVIELECRSAVLTCLNFMQLAGQGFYDGTVFHRVVPDFVVQAGDPRGDGFGGPGYTLRHEPTLLRYDRGVLGMAHTGPETAGSQFFVTLSPQPHLDGAYAAFGRVVAGQEVLDEIVQGDKVLRMAEVGSP